MSLLRRGIISSGKLDAGGGTTVYAANDADFDGSGDNLQQVSQTEFTIPADKKFSFEYSINADSFPASAWVASKYGTSSEYLVGFRGTSATLIVINAAVTANLIDINFTYTFLVSTQYHIVINSDGANARLYVNGALEQTVAHSTSAHNISTDPFGIGARVNPSVIQAFNGRIGMLRKYNKTLSLSEVQQNYNSGDILCSTSAVAGAVCDWRLANWTGTVGQELTDYGSGGHNFTNPLGIAFTAGSLSVEC